MLRSGEDTQDSESGGVCFVGLLLCDCCDDGVARQQVVASPINVCLTNLPACLRTLPSCPSKLEEIIYAEPRDLGAPDFRPHFPSQRLYQQPSSSNRPAESPGAGSENSSLGCYVYQ